MTQERALRRLLLVLVGWVVSLTIGVPARAQTATVRGFVTDAANGQALQGVNVVMQTMSGEPVQGSATNEDGFYAIAEVPAGQFVLQASFVGYAPTRDTIRLEAGQVLTRNLEVYPAEVELDEVEVASQQETGARTPTAGLEEVQPRDIERIPSPSVSGDLAGYLQTLPGVVASGDRGGQFFVRGGTPTQNLTLLDGMIVYQPFHIVGFYSAYPADLIKQVDFYAGGFGAEYSGRLSSVIDVQTREGSKQDWKGSVTAAPFLAGAQVEGPLWPGKVSVLASLRESLIQHTSPLTVGRELPYQFGDRFAKVHAAFGKSFRASLAALQTHDAGFIDPQQADEPVASGRGEVQWDNQSYSGHFLFLPAGFPMLGDVLLSYARMENVFIQGGSENLQSSIGSFNGQVRLSYFLGPADLHVGGSVRSTELTYDLTGQFQGLEAGAEYVTEAGLYAESDMEPVTGWTVQPGVRLQAFPSLRRTELEPRLRMSWQVTSRQQLSAAWGLYHQEIVGLNDRRDAGNVFTAWVATPFADNVPEAVHYILGYEMQPLDWLQASVEGYYKTLSNLRIPEWTAFPQFEVDLVPADGTVRGLDLRLTVDYGSFYGYLGYGYSDVSYRAQLAEFPLWYGEVRETFPPPHERPHQVSALSSVSLGAYDLSVRWQFGAGRPYSQAIGFDMWLLLQNPTVDVTREPGEPRVLYGQPYDARLPNYHRLDVSLARTFHPSESVSATVQASLINAYDRRNLFYLDLFTLQRVNQLPLVPSLGVEITID